MATNFRPRRAMTALLGIGAIAILGACRQEPTDTAVEPVEEEPTLEEPVPLEDEASIGAETATEASGTIVDTASAEESLTILVQAIEAAGLTEPLMEGGPYTVFAPTNEAFESLPEGTLDQLLQPANQETLAQLLSYHVVPQEVTSADITPGDVESLAGPPLTIEVDEATGNVMVNNATVTQTDLSASNGVIHLVDQVILPPGVEPQ